MQPGPKLVFHPQDNMSTVHDQLILLGMDQSVKSNSPSSKTVLDKSQTPNREILNTLEKTRSQERKQPSLIRKVKKRDVFLGEMRKIKFVKQAVKKLLMNSSFFLYHQLKKVHYRIIGDPVQEAQEVCENETEFKLNAQVF